MSVRPDTEDLIAFLNSLVAIDRNAIQELIVHRVPCNDALAEHPTVQVASAANYSTTVGLLGILNGYCGTIEGGTRDGWGPISARFDDDGLLVEFGFTTEDRP